MMLICNIGSDQQEVHHEPSSWKSLELMPNAIREFPAILAGFFRCAADRGWSRTDGRPQ